MVTKLGMANAQQHLLGLFPDGIALQPAFVAPTQVQLHGTLDYIGTILFMLQGSHTFMVLLHREIGFPQRCMGCLSS